MSTFQFLLVEGETLVFKGFLPEQSSTTTFSSAERISERIMEQIVGFPVAGGGIHDFRPRQSSSSVAHSPAAWLNTEDEPFQGVFSTLFPRKKKVRLTPGTMGARVPRHVSSSTSSAFGLRSWMTTRVRLGRCSRIRRSARGGTACARTAPSGTRRGSAELGCCWWCTGSRAWHPLAPSWVPLPTPGQVKYTGVLHVLGVWRFCSCSVDVLAGAVDHRLCPCAHAETLFCLQFLDLVDMQVIVHCQVRSHCGDVVDTLVVVQRQIPMVLS